MRCQYCGAIGGKSRKEFSAVRVMAIVADALKQTRELYSTDRFADCTPEERERELANRDPSYDEGARDALHMFEQSFWSSIALAEGRPPDDVP